MEFVAIIVLGSALTLLAPALVAAFFVSKYGKGWLVFAVLVPIQLGFLFTFGYWFLERMPSSAWVVYPGAIAIVMALSAILGTLAYPFLFFLAYRPENWPRKLVPWLALTVAGILLWVGPRAFRESGIVTDVDLHGRVVDIDGRPVAGAVVNLDNCPYFERNPVYTDADGRFRIVANCSNSLLIVTSIVDAAAGGACLTQMGDYFELNRMFTAYNSSAHRGVEVSDFGWRAFPADDPQEITCVFRLPEKLRHYRLQDARPVPDGRTYTAVEQRDSRGEWYIELLEGEHDGLMRLQLAWTRAGEAWTGPGSLTLYYPDGGLQAADDSRYRNFAPVDGYTESLEFALTSPGDRTEEYLYFHGPDRAVYGAMRVRTLVSFNFRTRVETPVVATEFWINGDGGRAILPHLAQRR